ncbi:MAG: hypothetical protein H0V24_18225 [Chloroflexia bacterium]|nr:hypothetical protein [Chloroflexia bacterium]MDQ3412001.1 hypothetical protein [Chloroflexota bacterium]
MGIEIARWLVALGSVAAAVGLTLVGMATSTLQPMDDLIQLSVILMIGGLAAFVVGMLAHRRLQDTDPSADY